MKSTLFTTTLALFVPLSLAVTACDEGAPAVEEGPIGSVVEAGKADNFLSLSAREYWVEGTTQIDLGSTWASKPEAERLKEVKRLIPYRQVVIGWFLNRYIVDKEHEDTYGGFKALTKNGSYEDLDLKKVNETTWSFTFRQEIGGQEDLIRALPDAKPNGDGTWNFDLWIGKISTADMQRLETDAEWYRSAPWGEFNPANVAADKKEIQKLKIRQQPAEDDAWMELDRLMDDGKLTIGIHFGWDYHSAYHEKHSKEVYTWLTTKKGFRSPVSKWEDLRHDAGPLTGTVTWRGKSVKVELSLFWGRKGDATDPDTAAGGKQLEADMLTSLKSREVVVFSGHSGPFYGFALANWRMTSEGDVDDSELEKVQLWKDHYQLIVAEGCDTYGIGQSFAANPSKPGLKDLDIITTTSFSNASTAASVLDLLTVLLGPIGKTTTTATKFSTFLDALDSNSSWFNSMYGVHGIDDNPHVHPWANLAKSCSTCSKQSDCGDGMRCVKMKDGKNACAAECTSSLGCGTGFECRNVAVNSTLSTQVCAPTGLTCNVPAPTTVGRLVINEIVSNPNADFNKDGTKDTSADEYVELVNAGNKALDLAGWTLSDATTSRHRFPTGTSIPPGGALVVFGGGQASLVAGTTVVQIASTKALGLNNTGDSVVVSDKDGIVVARVDFGSVVSGKSWARAKDLDPSAAFSAVAPSPGTKNDGSNF
ncbi:MAG: lamin tail domain-containing protein [Deltaproteobacteria bacterium]|nr:lamin tail domain-containing protein [Deltaproteobacteria bacterium]